MELSTILIYLQEIHEDPQNNEKNYLSDGDERHYIMRRLKSYASIVKKLQEEIQLKETMEMKNIYSAISLINLYMSMI